MEYEEVICNKFPVNIKELEDKSVKFNCELDKFLICNSSAL